MTAVDPQPIRIECDAEPSLVDVLALYEAVGWTAYTDDPETLSAAIRGSSFVVAAWADDRLVGLIRALSDDATIMYLQDILVDPSHHRRGVGRALAETVLNRFQHVRQKMLLTDDDPAQKGFYESLGFTQVGTDGAERLRSFVILG
ncbi:GNAT family N-acetyltransferase [Arthrobacter sp. RCC_34]|uniref:GNAT family N-acetyltransferase n=1 Tax=Arthrobacter sp. RCC_34 TaxID=3239230 RepID=UPI003526C2A0